MNLTGEVKSSFESVKTDDNVADLGSTPNILPYSAAKGQVETVQTANETQEQRHSLFISTFGARDAGDAAKARENYPAAVYLLYGRFDGEYTDEARDEIYAKTGWRKGADNKWRFELPPLKTSPHNGELGSMIFNPHDGFKAETAPRTTIGNLVTAPILFKAHAQFQFTPPHWCCFHPDARPSAAQVSIYP